MVAEAPQCGPARAAHGAMDQARPAGREGTGVALRANRNHVQTPPPPPADGRPCFGRFPHRMVRGRRRTGRRVPEDFFVVRNTESARSKNCRRLLRSFPRQSRRRHVTGFRLFPIPDFWCGSKRAARLAR
ncbi:MAG: hypothetical protein ACK53Y_01990, partial [bacterium]